MRFIITSICILISFSTCKQNSNFHDYEKVFKSREADSLYFKATDYENNGDLKYALVFFNMADSIEPTNPTILHSRGLLRSRMGDNLNAIKDITMSILHTKNDKIRKVKYLNRGLIYQDLNKMDSACQDWKMAAEWGESLIKENCN